MTHSVRVALMGAFASALFGWLPNLISAAHAQAEITLNSSTVQVVHNAATNTDVLNLSLNVTSAGDTAGSCDSEMDDLLETGVRIGVSRFSCGTFGAAFCFFVGCLDFSAQVNYVEHDIGNFSYGTSFAPNGPGSGSVSSKIVALSTPPNTCGTWTINLQATGQNLSGITGPPVALFVNESDFLGEDDAVNCFTVNANVGNGITKPHRGVHRARH
jgi:hypothetical protein